MQVRVGELLAIHVVQENIVAAIPAAHYMVNRPRILNADLTWHGRVMDFVRIKVKSK